MACGTQASRKQRAAFIVLVLAANAASLGRAGSFLSSGRKTPKHILVEVEPPHKASAYACKKMEDQTLEEGQVLVQIVKFVFRGLELSYIFMGNNSLQMFQHFPVPSEIPNRQQYGRPAVWGVGVVVASKAAGVPAGTRITRGLFPMSPYVVLNPTEVTHFGFVDGAAHRQGSPLYLRYYDNSTPAVHEEWSLDSQFLVGWAAAMTAALDKPRARTLLVTSASSRTGRVTAWSARHEKLGFEIVGVTSARNVEFTRRLGVYDDVLLYDEIPSLPKQTTAVLDVAGNQVVSVALYRHLGDNLVSFRGVGESHLYQRHMAPPSSEGLRGAVPQWFLVWHGVQAVTDAYGEEEYVRRRDAAAGAWYYISTQTPRATVRHYGVQESLAAIRKQYEHGLDAGSMHFCSLWTPGAEEPKVEL